MFFCLELELPFLMRNLTVASLAIVASLLSVAPSYAGGITGGVRNELGNDYNKTIRNLDVKGASSLNLTKVSTVEFCATEFSFKQFTELAANGFKAGIKGGKFGGTVFADGTLTLSSGYTQSAAVAHGKDTTTLQQAQHETYKGTEKTVFGGDSSYHEATSFSGTTF